MADLNKKALAEKLADTGLVSSKKAAMEVVDVLFDEMVAALKDGNKVDIYGFGKFEVKERAARSGRNPATKETIEIPASKVPGFKAAKALKEAVK